MDRLSEWSNRRGQARVRFYGEAKDPSPATRSLVATSPRKAGARWGSLCFSLSSRPCSANGDAETPPPRPVPTGRGRDEALRVAGEGRHACFSEFRESTTCYTHLRPGEEHAMIARWKKILLTATVIAIQGFMNPARVTAAPQPPPPDLPVEQPVVPPVAIPPGTAVPPPPDLPVEQPIPLPPAPIPPGTVLPPPPIPPGTAVTPPPGLPVEPPVVPPVAIPPAPPPPFEPPGLPPVIVQPSPPPVAPPCCCMCQPPPTNGVPEPATIMSGLFGLMSLAGYHLSRGKKGTALKGTSEQVD